MPESSAAKLTQDAGLKRRIDAVRWGLLLSSVAVAGFRLPHIFRDLRAWREVRFSDPSAADFYRTSFQVSVIGIAIVLIVGVGIFYLLGRRGKPQVLR
jgi:lysylphosphatidylglycerol synthetase-like protein (DUF2156 family)